MRVLARLALLSLAASAGLAAAPDTSTDAATAGSIALPTSPVEERAKALAPTLHFRSKGTIRAMLIRLDRDLKIEMAPVMKDGRLTSVDTTVVDVAHGNKVYHDVLPMSARGTLSAKEPHLINATNLMNITPEIREQLKAGHAPVTLAGRIDTDGQLRGVHYTHALVSADAGGRVVIDTTTESDDGDVHFKTRSIIAPDGMPEKADTTGTVKKGPIDVAVNIHLTRE